MTLGEYYPSDLSILHVEGFHTFCDWPPAEVISIKELPGQLQVVDDKKVEGPERDGGHLAPGDPGVGTPVKQPSS